MDKSNSQLPGHPLSVESMPGATDAPMLIARRVRVPAGTHLPAHQHPRGQFLFAVTGTMFVRTPGHGWLVPSSRALWVPAGITHAIDAHGDLQMRSLYLNAQGAAKLPGHCAVLQVSALLRELILRMTHAGHQGPLPDLDLIPLLALREISQLPTCSLELPMPTSADLLTLAEAVWQNPHRKGPEAQALGSPRTLYRRFRTETGLSFVQWRKQACLLHAVRRLGTGQAVTQVALDLGYDSPSAFTTMFRRALGVAPKSFMANRATDRHEA